MISKDIARLFFENMADKTDFLLVEERIIKPIKKVFEDEFKKQEQNLAKIIRSNLEITMQIIKSLKNEVNELKRIMEFMLHDLEERLNNVEKNMCKVREDLKEICEYQVDSDSLMDIRNKLTELKDKSRSNNVRIDEIAEEPGET